MWPLQLRSSIFTLIQNLKSVVAAVWNRVALEPEAREVVLEVCQEVQEAGR